MRFRISNDWIFTKNFINIELFSIHWESFSHWITILGISFIWEY